MVMLIASQYNTSMGDKSSLNLYINKLV